MTNLTDLPYEIRLLIWEAVLRQPRNVYTNMRAFPTEPGAYICGYNQESVYQCLCSTPAPVLLHICRETRTLALAHYELAFGWAHCPPLRQAGVIHHGFFIKGEEWTTTVESNEAEVAKHCAKVYFNFEQDTVVFGRFLSRPEESTSSSGEGLGSRAYFPFGEQFDFKMLARIRNLAVSIDIASAVLLFLDQPIVLERFSSLKNIYVYIESDDDMKRRSPKRVVELVDLKGAEKDDEIDMAQKLADKLRSVSGRRSNTIDGPAHALLTIISKDGLRFWRYFRLRELLLANGADPDELLKFVCLREVNTIQPS